MDAPHVQYRRTEKVVVVVRRRRRRRGRRRRSLLPAVTGKEVGEDIWKRKRARRS